MSLGGLYKYDVIANNVMTVIGTTVMKSTAMISRVIAVGCV